MRGHETELKNNYYEGLYYLLTGTLVIMA